MLCKVINIEIATSTVFFISLAW